MSHRTNILPFPAIDLAPTGKAAYAADRHDRAEDPVQAARIERQVDRIIAVLRATAPAALAKTVGACSDETAEAIVDDMAVRLRAAQA
ncbi:MAG: hypothetical protein HOY79_07385 [Streptomyces sp.]|nr:hypothetical protein [Streptomyces sp.]